MPDDFDEDFLENMPPEVPRGKRAPDAALLKQVERLCGALMESDEHLARGWFDKSDRAPTPTYGEVIQTDALNYLEWVSERFPKNEENETYFNGAWGGYNNFVDACANMKSLGASVADLGGEAGISQFDGNR